jgi:hypothetical protein
MDTLPRFRFSDESSQNVSAVRSGAWDFDDLDNIETRVLPRENEFDAIPTRVRAKACPANGANVDDVVEELRAAAAGRSSRVRELPSTEVLDDWADVEENVQEVDVSDLVFDRPVTPREVWRVHKATRPMQATLAGPTDTRGRFVMTAALAMLGGGIVAVAIALVVWRLTGLHFY